MLLRGWARAPLSSPLASARAQPPSPEPSPTPQAPLKGVPGGEMSPSGPFLLLFKYFSLTLSLLPSPR